MSILIVPSSKARLTAIAAANALSLLGLFCKAKVSFDLLRANLPSIYFNEYVNSDSTASIEKAVPIPMIVMVRACSESKLKIIHSPSLELCPLSLHWELCYLLAGSMA